MSASIVFQSNVVGVQILRRLNADTTTEGSWNTASTTTSELFCTSLELTIERMGPLSRYLLVLAINDG